MAANDGTRCAKCGEPRVTVGHGSLGSIPPAGHAFVPPAPVAQTGRMGEECKHGFDPEIAYECSACEIDRLRRVIEEAKCPHACTPPCPFDRWKKEALR